MGLLIPIDRMMQNTLLQSLMKENSNMYESLSRKLAVELKIQGTLSLRDQKLIWIEFPNV